MGRQAPVGSSNSAVHGPAATRTAPASSDVPSSSRSVGPASIRDRADAEAQLGSGAFGASRHGLGGRMRRDGVAGRQQDGGQAACQHRLALVEGLLVQEGGSQGTAPLAFSSATRAWPAAVVIGQQQEAGRLGGEGEPAIGQGAVVLQRGLMQRREDPIEGVLDHAGVAARRPRRRSRSPPPGPPTRRAPRRRRPPSSR